MNNSQALDKLKQSAKKQTEELKSFNHEIHQENWSKLSKNLEDITIKKLNKIEKNINQKMEDIEEKNKGKCNLKSIIITMLVTLIIGILGGVILAEYTPKYQERTMWLVPKEMRYEQEGERYIKSQKPIIGKDNTTTYIRIEE